MKKMVIPFVLTFLATYLTATPAQAGSSSVTSVSWNVKTLNVGSLDPDKSDAKATLRIKAKDTEGVCGIIAAISNSKARKTGVSFAFREFENISGSSENGTWSATFNEFGVQNTGTWIVEAITVIDCFGRTLKQNNKKSGLGGANGKLKVTLGTKSSPKIAVSALKTDNYDETPYKLAITVIDSKKKPVKGASIRITVCEDFLDTLDYCSYVNLGKTNSKGKLTASFYPALFYDKGNTPDWATGPVGDESKLLGYISVLPTKKFSYALFSKSVKLDNSYCSDIGGSSTVCGVENGVDDLEEDYEDDEFDY